MSEPVFPLDAEAVPSPWCRTSWRERRQGRGGRADHDPAADDLARLLDAVLGALEEVGPAEVEALPASLIPGWVFVEEWLSEAMPTLASATREALAARLRELEPTISEAELDGVAAFWARSVLVALLSELLGEARSGNVADVLAARLPGADTEVAEVLRDHLGP